MVPNQAKIQTNVVPFTSAPTVCYKCATPLNASERHCLACRADNGAPNVRECSSSEETKELSRRYHMARENARSSGLEGEFVRFQTLLEQNSLVVVAVPALLALNLVSNPSCIYQAYEQLVNAGARSPASPPDDRRRPSISGCLFGSYAKRIVYGALSTTSAGLPTYGDVYFRLKASAVDDRTTFLESNSYRFVEQHPDCLTGPVPRGYRSNWQNRHQLALAKLAGNLTQGQNDTDMQRLLLTSDSADRANDDFVEAHVYEGFNRHSIESIDSAPLASLTRADRTAAHAAIEMFEQMKGRTS